MKMKQALDWFDENMDTLMLVMTIVCAIILIAIGVRYYLKDLRKVSLPTAPVKIQIHPELSKRGDPGWPPVKEKHRMA